jgi:hypothetical protein
MRNHADISETIPFLKRKNIFFIYLFTCVLFWLVAIFFYNNLVPFGFIITGFFTIVAYFGLHRFLFISFRDKKDTQFVFKLFFITALLRITAALVLYFFYLQETGEPFEYNAVDSKYYHLTALTVSKYISQGNYTFFTQLSDAGFSDRGFSIFLGFIYYLSGGSILFARLVNALISTITVVYVYKTGKALFSESTGRSAAIATMLLPNFMLYLGTNLKETLMVFLVTVFLYQIILFIKYRRRNLLLLAGIILLLLSLFMFRTVLGAVAILTFMGYAFTLNPSKYRVVNVLPAILLIIVLGYMILNSEIGIELATYIEKSSTALSDNLQFRAEREGGNKYALLAGVPLFLSIILIAPFPSFVYVEDQTLLWMFIGANVIRNIYAFFTIAGVFFVCRRDFKNASVLIYFVFSYLLILANSGFAISERFHLPVVPCLLLLSCVGLEWYSTKRFKGFPVYLFALVLLIIGWNYIKIAGRI